MLRTEIKKSSKVCGDHFKESDFEYSMTVAGKIKKQLKYTVIPCKQFILSDTTTQPENFGEKKYMIFILSFSLLKTDKPFSIKYFFLIVIMLKKI